MHCGTAARGCVSVCVYDSGSGRSAVLTSKNSSGITEVALFSMSAISLRNAAVVVTPGSLLPTAGRH